MPSLAARRHQSELMDNPDLDAERFVGSLVGLRRVNRVTGSARILWPEIRAAAMRAGRPLRVLDVACGGGDTLIWFANRARRDGVTLALAGCDINPLAIEFAQKHAAAARVSAEFFEFDAVRDAVPADFDIIMSSFFLHHLEETDAIRFLRNAANATRGRVLIHDLARSRAGYWLAAIGLRALLCNDVCRVDGPRSVESAFTASEARSLAERAGLTDAHVETRFPFRYIMKWAKS
jgi:2-polyprenyl-3-methyl-5-hydroxy-6-metoxy-1,4-benzoquinol methylase